MPHALSKVQKTKLYDYIIAAYIPRAAMNFKIKVRPSMQGVCDAMSIDYDDLLKPSPGIPEGLTKAKWVEDRIRRFAGGKDWRQRAGTKKEEAKKRRDKQAVANESTAELKAAMAALTTKPAHVKRSGSLPLLSKMNPAPQLEQIINTTFHIDHNLMLVIICNANDFS
jgi:hypothetical protein